MNELYLLIPCKTNLHTVVATEGMMLFSYSKREGLSLAECDFTCYIYLFIYLFIYNLITTLFASKIYNYLHATRVPAGKNLILV